MYGYVYKTRQYTHKYRTRIPDITEFDSWIEMDWTKSIYGDCDEEIPDNAPKLLGKQIVLVHFFDANLMHDVLTGKAVT